MNVEQLQSLYVEKDDALKEVRHRSFDALVKKGLPTIRSEEWRYTNLDAISMAGKITPVHNDNKHTVESFGFKPVFENSIRVLIVDCAENDLSKNIKKSNEVFDSEEKALVLVNASFLGGAREIKISQNEKSQPIEIFYFNSENIFANNRLKIVLENSASLTLVEHFKSGANAFSNYVTRIELKEKSVLNHIVIQDENILSDHINTVDVFTKQEAHYHAFALGLGGKIYRRDIDAKIKGEESFVGLSGVHLVGENQHMDASLVTTHEVKNCKSNQHYKTILQGNGKGVFQGKIKVERGADFTDAHQLNNALLLSDKAQMNAKPELIIYADEVQCSHGATMGQIDEQALFYLRSRGLSKAEAYKLLIEAFVGEVLNDIQEEVCSSSIRELVLQWLNTK